MTHSIAVFVGIAPFSWRLGTVRIKPGVKRVYAFGPLRLSIHRIAH